MPEPLPLPRGPLTAHLQAAHAIVENLARAVSLATGVSCQEAVTAHEHHVRTVAAYTADPGECPPRPEPGRDEDGYPAVPEGWSSVVCGIDPALGDEHPPVVLCGWTDDGYFHQYAPTEAIVTVAVEAIQEAHRG